MNTVLVLPRFNLYNMQERRLINKEEMKEIDFTINTIDHSLQIEYDPRKWQLTLIKEVEDD